MCRVGADEIDPALQGVAIDLDAYQVAVAQPPDRATGQRLRPHVADAGAGGDAGETRVGQHRHVLAPGQVFQRGGELVGLLHAGAGGAAAGQHHHVAGHHRTFALAFDGDDRLVLGREHARRAGVAVHIVVVDHGRVDRGGLDHRAIRRKVADREHQRRGEPRGTGRVRAHDHVGRIDAVQFAQAFAGDAACGAVFPPIEILADGAAADGGRVQVQQAHVAQMQHHLGHAAGHEHLHRGMVARAVGQRVDQARRGAVGGGPVGHGRRRQAGRVGDRRHVQHQVGGAAERGVHHQCVLQRVAGEDGRHRRARLDQTHQRQRRAPRHVQPHRLAGRRQRGVRQRDAQRLGDHLRGGRGAQELAAAAGRAAGAAAHRGGVLQVDQSVRVAGADGLHLGGVLGAARGQRHAAGHDHAGQVAAAGQRHHHRRQALVAGGDAEQAAAVGQRAHQPAHRHRRVVAVRQAVEHAGGALGAPVAGVRAHHRERQAALLGQRLGRRAHQLVDLPMTGMQAQRHRAAVGGAQAALGAEDQVRIAPDLAGAPAHAGVLGHAEQVAAGRLAQGGVVDRQTAGRAFAGGAGGGQRGAVTQDGIQQGIVTLHAGHHRSAVVNCPSTRRTSEPVGLASRRDGGSRCWRTWS